MKDRNGTVLGQFCVDSGTFGVFPLEGMRNMEYNTLDEALELALLRISGDYIQEVADQCGFPSANYFARLFKRQYGISPREFREHIQKKP